MCVLASALSTSGTQNKLKLKLWETISFNVALVILAVLFVYHYYSVVDNIYQGAITPGENGSGEMVGGIVEIGFIISAMVFATIWYHTYYKNVVARRNFTDIKIQKALDKEFEMIPNFAEEANKTLVD
jgi:hypothetical protein